MKPWQKIQALMSPEDSWGPALVKHRIMVNYVSGFVLDPSSMNSDGSYDNPKKDQKRTKPHTFGTRIGSSAENKNTGLASSSSSSDNTSSDISCSSDFGKSRSERTTRSSSREVTIRVTPEFPLCYIASYSCEPPWIDKR